MTIKDKITELENLSEGSFFQSNPRAQKIKAILDEDGNNIFHTIIHENNESALRQVLTATQSVPNAVVDALTTANQAGQTPIGLLLTQLEQGDKHAQKILAALTDAEQPLFKEYRLSSNPLLQEITRTDKAGNTIFDRAAPSLLDKSGPQPLDCLAEKLKDAPSYAKEYSTYAFLSASKDPDKIDIFNKAPIKLTNFVLQHASTHPNMLENLLTLARKDDKVQKALKKEAVYRGAYSHLPEDRARALVAAIIGEPLEAKKFAAYTALVSTYRDFSFKKIQANPTAFIQGAHKAMILSMPSRPPYPHQTFLRFAEKTGNLQLAELYKDHPLQQIAKISPIVEEKTPYEKISGIRSISDFIAEADIETLVTPGIGALYNSAQEVQYMARLIRSGAGAASTINLDRKRSIFSPYYSQDDRGFYVGAGAEMHERYIKLTEFIETCNINPIESATRSQNAQDLIGTMDIFRKVIEGLKEDPSDDALWGHLETLAEIEDMPLLLDALPSIKASPAEVLEELETAVSTFDKSQINTIIQKVSQPQADNIVQPHLQKTIKKPPPPPERRPTDLAGPQSAAPAYSDTLGIEITEEDKLKSRNLLLEKFITQEDSVKLKPAQIVKVKDNITIGEKTSLSSYFLARAVEEMRKDVSLNKEQLYEVALFFAKDLGGQEDLVDNLKNLDLEQGFAQFCTEIKARFPKQLAKSIIEHAHRAVTPHVQHSDIVDTLSDSQSSPAETGEAHTDRVESIREIFSQDKYPFLYEDIPNSEYQSKIEAMR